DGCFAVGEVNHQALFGRVADLGIGTAHDGPTPTTESLSAALKTTLTPRPAHERPPWPARSAPTGRRWPRRCCSTRSAERGRQRPREPRGISDVHSPSPSGAVIGNRRRAQQRSGYRTPARAWVVT